MTTHAFFDPFGAFAGDEPRAPVGERAAASPRALSYPALLGAAWWQLPAATRVFVGHDYQPATRTAPAWETTVSEQMATNIHVHDGVTEGDAPDDATPTVEGFCSHSSESEESLTAPT